MLMRGRGFFPRPGRAAALAVVEPAELPRPERRLPQSPIYPPATADDARRDPTLGDRLLQVMRSGKYCRISEMVARLPAAELVLAVDELLDTGHYFERAGAALRLRARGDREPRQRVVELLDGLDLSAQAELPVVEPAAEISPGFDPGQDAGEQVVEQSARKGVLVLSDPPSALSLSASGWASSTRTILAKRGAGKTYLAGVMLEEVLEKCGNDRPMVVVVDPGGVWWGLLATSAGVPSTHEILLLGGSRGHLPLAARDGAAAADVACHVRPRTLILDLSAMAPVEQHQLVADFCNHLWSREHFPVHVFVDEADEFAPQRFGALAQHQRRSLDALSRMFMRGRARGMGGTLISLRPAVLAKNLLSQVEDLVLLRLLESNDIRAASTWLENFEHQVTPQQRADCLSHLPVLPTGTAYFLRGGDRPMFRKFKVREKHTYDSSDTLTSRARGNPRLSCPPPEVLQSAREILAAGHARDGLDEGLDDGQGDDRG